MVNTLEKKHNLEGRITVVLPFLYGLSHVNNVNHCIEQLKAHKDTKSEGEFVLGYRIETTSWGSREKNFSILPMSEAEKLREELKGKNRIFEYRTLDDLLSYKKEIDRGKYKIYNGRIIGLNQNYGE